MLIKDISKELYLNRNITVKGWVRSYRKQYDICFININDGSTAKELQILVNKEENNELFEKVEKINNGCYRISNNKKYKVR
jgi:asparaginyl-tRNA synthetase